LNNYTSLVDTIIKNEVAGLPMHEIVLDLGPTPDYLIRHAGFPILNLGISASVISKAHFDHGIVASKLKKLPQIIAAPKHLYKSANAHQVDSVVVLTLEIKGTSPIIVPIRKNRQIGRNDFRNLVTSMYGKDGPDPELKWKREGLLLWSSPT